MTITASDGEPANSTSSVSFVLTVRLLVPTLTLSGPSGVDEGSAYSLTLDPPGNLGPHSIQSYFIHWGDGHTDTISAVQLPANRQVQHIYADGPSTQVITVDLMDQDGAAAWRARSTNPDNPL